MSEPKSRRIPKPFWFGVAAVLMVMLWFVLTVWLPYHREQVTKEEVWRLGGFCYFETKGPEWLRELVGDDRQHWFDKVEEVYFCQSNFADKSNIEHLRYVALLTSDIRDAQLSMLIHKIVPLRYLRKMRLSGTSTTDEGLRHIGRLHQLTSLDLNGTKITDAGLKHIGQLHNLESLSLWLTDISDDGLENLNGLSKLRSLDVKETQVTEAGVKKLQKVLPNCKIIHRPRPAVPIQFFP